MKLHKQSWKSNQFCLLVQKTRSVAKATISEPHPVFNNNYSNEHHDAYKALSENQIVKWLVRRIPTDNGSSIVIDNNPIRQIITAFFDLNTITYWLSSHSATDLKNLIHDY